MLVQRLSNIVLMLGQRRSNNSTERQVNVFTGPSECIPFDKQIYQSAKAQWVLLMSNV